MRLQIIISLFIHTGVVINKESLSFNELQKLAEIAIKAGKYLGYPSCCTQWLLANRLFKSNGISEQQEAVHGGNGFVPCPICAQKVTAETIGTLIKDRVCSTPYPEWTAEDKLRFLKTLL